MGNRQLASSRQTTSPDDIFVVSPKWKFPGSFIWKDSYLSDVEPSSLSIYFDYWTHEVLSGNLCLAEFVELVKSFSSFVVVNKVTECLCVKFFRQVHFYFSQNSAWVHCWKRFLGEDATLDMKNICVVLNRRNYFSFASHIITIDRKESIRRLFGGTNIVISARHQFYTSSFISLETNYTFKSRGVKKKRSITWESITFCHQSNYYVLVFPLIPENQRYSVIRNQLHTLLKEHILRSSRK